MARWYGSFLIRCWRLSDNTQRIEIEHMQSGARAWLPTLTAAVTWISAKFESWQVDRPGETGRAIEEGRR